MTRLPSSRLTATGPQGLDIYARQSRCTAFLRIQWLLACPVSGISWPRFLQSVVQTTFARSQPVIPEKFLRTFLEVTVRAASEPAQPGQMEKIFNDSCSG